MPEHGGRLRRAAAEYGIPLSEWLDLSTGINRRGYPPGTVADHHWHRLPEGDDGLVGAAEGYYGSRDLVPVPGTDAAIQWLPGVLAALAGSPRRCLRVGVPATGYSEHAAAWRREGHDAVPLTSGEVPGRLDGLDVLVVINPNNPTGERVPKNRLLEWHGRLTGRGGWLVVDEAFIDSTPAASLVAEAGRKGLVVLRSPGKFFGLAGARVGFAAGAERFRSALAERLGPWPVAGPGRAVVTRALSDTGWQAAARTRLARDAGALDRLLRETFDDRPRGTDLFRTVVLPDAAHWHHRLARRAVLVRLLDDRSGLRFGIPGSDREHERLATALTAAAREVA